MISGISFAALPKINFKGGTEKPYSNNLERTPQTDTLNLREISREEKKEPVYQFKLGDGSPFEGTVKEFLEASIIRWNKADDQTMYHVPYTTDDGEQMLKEGLNWKKTRRMQAGPGTYFSPSLGCGEFSGLGYKAIEGRYIGDKKEYPVMEKGFYDRLCEGAPITAAEYHDIMVNDLGVDFIYAGTGRAGGAYVVLNDNCMSLKKGW